MTSAKDVDAKLRHNDSEQDETRHIGHILKDTGSAFASASVLGTFWVGFQGARDAPRGARLAGAVEKVQLKAVKWSGTAARWGFAFSASRHILHVIRGKEDYFSFGTSAMIAGAMHSARKGLKRAVKDAVIYGIASFSCIGFIVGFDYCRSQLLESSSTSGKKDLGKENERTFADEEEWTELSYEPSTE